MSSFIVMADRRSTVELVAVLFLLFQSTFGQLVPLSSGTERLALLDLRSSLGLRGKDWPRKADPCLVWVGVQCRDGRVVGINISGMKRTRLGRLNPQFSVNALANFTLLASFNSSRLSLPGSIPDWFGLRLLSLQLLDLRSCSVVGPIPWSLGNLTNLSSLYLSDNSLTGIVPPTLGRLSGLSVLHLSQNSLTGAIPTSLSSLRNLTLLDLSSNFLDGQIPPVLGSLSNLQFLNLSNNSLSASIPGQLGDLSRLVELDLGLNSLSGLLPTDLRGLRSLQKMVVGNNALAGPLPDNLFLGLTQLQFVVLGRNNFSGDFPSILWLMPELRFLDASHNNFTGVLPNLSSYANATAVVFNLSHNLFYGSLTSGLLKFSSIDLSNNYFQGRVPDETSGNASLAINCLQNVPNQRSLKDCTSFYTERGLSFDNFGAPNATQPPVPGPTRKSNRRLKFILVGVLGGLGFILLLVLMLVLLLRMCKRGITNQRGTGVGSVYTGGSQPPPGASINFATLGESFTYEQLLRATGDFSDSNLIKHGHSGDFWRGILEGDIPVVIKRIDVRSFKKELYMVELNLFSRTLHTRLVPLLGHCLEHENEKLLVYKYMLNGDLSNTLYRKTNSEDDSLQSLDWITRLKIAIGAAEGLCYLHHECIPPLVHRTSEQGASGSLSATCAYDVYCFGKVLLELVTGKLGISASDDSTTKKWLEHTLPYISIYEKELVTKIVDPSLIVDEDLLEEVWAMAIVARSCLNPKSSKRPLMRYILKALENPLKVVREENSSSDRLRSASSRGSLNAALFGSWRHSSSDVVAVPVSTHQEGASSFKQSGTADSQGSGQGGGYDLSSSHKKLSKDTSPEPADVREIEKSDED
ncbi:hypothetical protein HHK36_002487 [Tetracentron sinense]|uniref:Protein kinase domain-containing protein n=1 Tax=Tetracentron sinense TaxID=13715 RepID=A0A835DRM4_TETSI|nr:hypothetical protein HHK36_002487 [Tetracentron sinense]